MLSGALCWQCQAQVGTTAVTGGALVGLFLFQVVVDQEVSNAFRSVMNGLVVGAVHLICSRYLTLSNKNQVQYNLR